MRRGYRNSLSDGYGRRFHSRGYRSQYDRYDERRGLFGRRRMHRYESQCGNDYGVHRGLLGYRQGYGYGVNQPFYRRQDGYDNYYGSQMVEPSLTSKILAWLTGIASKAKSCIHKEPQAASSNVQYDGSVREGDYVEADVIL